MICLVYTKIIMFFNQLRFYWKKNNEIATASLNQYVQMHSKARDITQSLEKHALLSSDIWQVYDRYMHVIYLQLDSFTSAGRFLAFLVLQQVPSALGRFRPGLSANPFVQNRSWQPKGHPSEAGACQSSTARCWSHKHGCPFASPGLLRWHIRIRTCINIDRTGYKNIDIFHL